MCGIAGKLYLDPKRSVSESELRRMARVMVHRGPDGEGVWIKENIGLAHRRLSIIDVRAVAGQPMSNEDGTVWITFNGEIYNFLELRKDLEAKGHTFRTNSDTETIVHAYEEYGRDCLTHLRGMFAFALWDTRSNKLFLARDRAGKKPLYYYLGSDRFLFGSEIKALLAEGSLHPDPDPCAIDAFLAFGFIQGSDTIFQGIKKLPAAHWLELSEGRVEIGRYWKLSYTPKRKLSLKDAIAELQWRIAEAVRLRLVSDVPLGAFLSGGIDSSMVVMQMAQLMSQPVKTFVVGFRDAAFDERRFARIIAEQCQTNHTELLVSASVLDILPRLVWHYDEPFGDSSAVPSFAIAECTRQHVKVVLNGDGGDELFAGYDRYGANLRARKLDAIPSSTWKLLETAMRCVPKHWRERQPFAKLCRIAEVMTQSCERRYATCNGHLTVAQRQALYAGEFQETIRENDPDLAILDVLSHTSADNWLDAMLDVDVSVYLVDDLLVKMDRATMASSLEARSPFLDHMLMEFTASLPPDLKLFGSDKKRLLKASLRGFVPDVILDRPKMGFSVPLASWLRGELRGFSQDILLSIRARQRGYFKVEAVEALLHQHISGLRDHSTAIWDLLMLEMWHQTFIDRPLDIPAISMSDPACGV